MLLDTLGVGPRVIPSELVACTSGVRVRRYPALVGAGPPVLPVPAPIKRYYIWDLAPEVSVVARCRDHGLRVCLAEWTDPGTHEDSFGLQEYADNLLMACVQAVARDTAEQRVFLIGHSLGGTFATIYAAPRRRGRDRAA